MIKDYLENVLIKRAVKFTKENFNYINNKDFAITSSLHNSKCHWNSYERMLIKPELKVLCTLCITPNEKTIFVHFINYSPKDNTYMDFTLGTCQLIYYYQYVVGECNLTTEDVGIECMSDKLIEMKHWVIDRCFTNKYVRRFYKWFQDKYEII